MRISTHFPFTPTSTSILIPSVFISAHALLDVHGTNNFDQRTAFVSNRTVIASACCACCAGYDIFRVTYVEEKNFSVPWLGMEFKGKLI
jgi:hypothetical protein